MEKVKLRAKERHAYDKRDLLPGDEYEATPEHAKTLTILGRAEYVTGVPTYQTRAMTAEQPALLVKKPSYAKAASQKHK